MMRRGTGMYQANWELCDLEIVVHVLNFHDEMYTILRLSSVSIQF